MGRIVGVVAGINRYPVKSLAGEALGAAEIRWTGIRGDREYAFVHADRLSRFPWFTARDVAGLIRYAAVCEGPYGPSGLPVKVRTPDGRLLAVSDPELVAELSAAAGAPIRPLQLSRGAHDAMPISVVTTVTLAAIDAAHGTPLDPRRFRINLIVESDERDTAWRHRVIEIGRDGPRLAISRPIERCAMITIDPDTSARDPSIMRTVARAFGNEAGEYASVLKPGIIGVGDEIRLLDEAPVTAGEIAELEGI